MAQSPRYCVMKPVHKDTLKKWQAGIGSVPSALTRNPQPKSTPAIPANVKQPTANTTQDHDGGGPGDAGFKAFWENPFDVTFPVRSQPSPVLLGASGGGLVPFGSVAAAGANSNSPSIAAASPAFAGNTTFVAPTQSLPRILLPANSGVVARQSGPQHGAGPNIATGLIDMNLPSFVAVNADDDNGSAVTNGIPATRDFSTWPLQKTDFDLLEAQLVCEGFPDGGTWATVITTAGYGNIDLWTDQKKDAVFLPSGEGTFYFYVEGTHESSFLNDVTLKFTYYAPDGRGGYTPHSTSASLPVTPLIQNFSVTPYSDAGDPNNQNVTFVIAPDAKWGLGNYTPARRAGVHFNASAIKTELNGDMRFIQNITGDDNGFNRTVDNQGRSVGWLWTDGTGERLGPKQGQYPFLDILPTFPDQSYTTPNFTSTVSPDGSMITLYDVDAPSTGAPTDNTAQGKVTAAVDVRVRFYFHLAWRWQQVVNGQTVTLFYPLAYVKWSVNFYAMPKNLINVLQGVTADTSYTRSNDPPGCMDMKNIWAMNNQYTYP